MVANLLLNVPPNNKGLIDPADSAALMGFASLRAKSFGHNLIRRSKVSIVADDEKKSARYLQDDNVTTSISVLDSSEQISVQLL